MEYRLILIGAAGWLAAQLCKMLLLYLETGRLQPAVLWSSGGMPSAHASLVCALTAALLRFNGAGSPMFQIMLFISLIVMHDAMGVRRQAGEHARALNSIIHETGPLACGADGEVISLYKEMIGHTPAQVAIGALLGTLVGLFLPTL